MKKYTYLLSMFLLATVISQNAYSDEKAIGIIQKADEMGRGWGSSSADVDMELFQQGRGSVYRAMRVKNLEIEKGGDKSMILIMSPLDMNGTVLLTHTSIMSADNQWLLLPALKRIKRISSSNKSGSFMGSEFAFEDLASFEVEKYNYRFLRNDKLGDLLHFVVEYIPMYKNSGYERMITWIDTRYYRVSKVEYFDRSGRHFKTLNYTDYNLHHDKFWRANIMTMQNHVNKNITTLKWKKFNFDVNYKSRDFNKNSMLRLH